MFYNLIPEALQNNFDALLNDLSYLPEKIKESCPFCYHSDFYKVRQKPLIFRCKHCQKYFNPLTVTPFNRLMPSIWLGMILTRRIEKTTYTTIAYELDCTIEMVRRRDKALISYMADNYPEFHQWYTQSREENGNELPLQVKQQHVAIINVIKQALTIEHVSCLYCESTNTIRLGSRTGFRCKKCRKTFSLFNRTPINRMAYPDRWIAFIDLLITNQTNKTIADTLKLNANTVKKWRQSWCEMMEIWGYNELSRWCNKKN